jgi:Beta/Gamma crystallin
MRQTFTRALILAATIGLAAAPAHAQRDRDMGGIGLTVWVDSDYRGSNHTFREDNPDLRSINMTNRISSLRAAQGEVWEVCTEPRYQGRCQVFSGNEPNLQSRGWNDTISSVRRVRGGGGGGGFPGRPPNGLELYAGLDYSGRRLDLTSATSDFRRMDFNDRAMSLRVPRNQAWEICVHNNFDDCRVVTDDVRDLNSLGLSRKLSSARPRSGRGIGGGGGGRPRLVLYDRPGYAGRSMTIENERGNLVFFNSQAGSAQVVGRWELCDEPGFKGRCVTVSSDVRDLARVGLRDRVSSVRPR